MKWMAVPAPTHPNRSQDKQYVYHIYHRFNNTGDFTWPAYLRLIQLFGSEHRMACAVPKRQKKFRQWASASPNSLKAYRDKARECGYTGPEFGTTASFVYVPRVILKNRVVGDPISKEKARELLGAYAQPLWRDTALTNGLMQTRLGIFQPDDPSEITEEDLGSGPPVTLVPDATIIAPGNKAVPGTSGCADRTRPNIFQQIGKIGSLTSSNNPEPGKSKNVTANNADTSNSKTRAAIATPTSNRPGSPKRSTCRITFLELSPSPPPRDTAPSQSRSPPPSNTPTQNPQVLGKGDRAEGATTMRAIIESLTEEEQQQEDADGSSEEARRARKKMKVMEEVLGNINNVFPKRALSISPVSVTHNGAQKAAYAVRWGAETVVMHNQKFASALARTVRQLEKEIPAAGMEFALRAIGLGHLAVIWDADVVVETQHVKQEPGTPVPGAAVNISRMEDPNGTVARRMEEMRKWWGDEPSQREFWEVPSEEELRSMLEKERDGAV